MAAKKITRSAWEKKYASAEAFMRTRSDRSAVLIEVAAQHPLLDGTRPGEEFAARLREAARLYERTEREGRTAVFYVPGSRHRHQGVADKISLSQAGVTFLQQLGIPPHALHGDDLNERYKSKAGVYNSADECFVAAAYFKDGDFGQLWSVVSPVQLMRKALHYLWFGIVPQMFSVPVVDAFHNYLREAYDAIPYVRDTDPDSQRETSAWAKRSRLERKPKNGQD
ncbi:MAG: hypothetical protein PHI63_05855 [Patescibacteria group bacterium]|nr:hypothetical protein [Patescibacteria group bacterium]